jgi:hypothetical protein
MSVEETERTVRAYLEALLQGGDFGAFFAEDVVWTTMETGEQVRGRQSVADFALPAGHRTRDRGAAAAVQPAVREGAGRVSEEIRVAA